MVERSVFRWRVPSPPLPRCPSIEMEWTPRIEPSGFHRHGTTEPAAHSTGGFRAVLRADLRVILEQFRCNFGADSEQIQSRFRADSEQFQSSFRAISEQFLEQISE